MRNLSILVCLDGSAYSRYAAELAWRIAKNTGANVTAHHVIDTKGTEEFIVQEPAGFLNGKLYRSAYNNVRQELRDLAHELRDTYLKESTRHGIRTDFVIDEGDPVLAIAERAKSHDLVIIGHKPHAERTKPLYRRQFLRLSVAEALSHDCPRPMLVVQGETELWSEMTVLVSIEHLNQNYVNACLDLAKLLSLRTNLTCLSSGDCEEPADRLIKDLRQSDPRLADVAIDVARLEDISMLDGQPVLEQFAEMDARRSTATLPVIPTRATGGNRVTVLDGSPTLFVRFLSLPSMLLLPEEHLLDTAAIPNLATQTV